MLNCGLGAEIQRSVGCSGIHSPVTIALLGGWLNIIALVGIYILLKNVVSVTVFDILLCTVLLIAAGWLYHWLMTKGTKILNDYR